MADRIAGKLGERFRPEHLEVVNESGGHNVPAGSQTHFRVVLVSEAFADQRPLARHRSVNETLAAELAGGVHALALHTYTPVEWRERFAGIPASPPCAGRGEGSAG